MYTHICRCLLSINDCQKLLFHIVPVIVQNASFIRNIDIAKLNVSDLSIEKFREPLPHSDI